MHYYNDTLVDLFQAIRLLNIVFSVSCSVQWCRDVMLKSVGFCYSMGVRTTLSYQACSLHIWQIMYILLASLSQATLYFMLSYS